MDNILFTQPNEKDKQIALYHFLNGVLDHRMNKEDWEWEYGTRKDESVFIVIKAGDNFLGSQGFIPIDLMVAKEKILTGKSENSFLDTSLRGKGMFEKLYEYGLDTSKEKKHQLVWGFTALVKVWREQLGFYVDTDAVFETTLTLKAFSNRKGFKALLYHFYQLRNSFITSGKLKSLVKKNSLQVKNELLHDVDLENFFAQFDSEHKNLVRLNYSKNYIQWRTIDIKASQYKHIYLYDSNHKIKAFAILNITDKLHISISDIMFADHESAVMLLDEIVHLAKTFKTASLRYFGNRKNELCLKVFSLLEMAGGKTYQNKTMNFVLKNISPKDFKECFEIKNWYITGLFTEGYKI